MSRSVVVSRYSRTLLRFVGDTARGRMVLAECERLLRAFATHRQMADIFRDEGGAVSDEQKCALLRTALGGVLSEDLAVFLGLLSRHRRLDLALDIFLDFATVFRRAQGTLYARLTFASPPGEASLARFRAWVKDETGCDAEIHVEVDPALMGGFVLDTGNYLCDASVRSQLSALEEQFKQRNRRIV